MTRNEIKLAILFSENLHNVRCDLENTDYAIVKLLNLVDESSSP